MGESAMQSSRVLKENWCTVRKPSNIGIQARVFSFAE